MEDCMIYEKVEPEPEPSVLSKNMVTITIGSLSKYVQFQIFRKCNINLNVKRICFSDVYF